MTYPIDRRTLLMGAAAIGALVATSAYAAQKLIRPYSNGRKGDRANEGYDVTAYFTAGAALEGSPAAEISWKGAIWRFKDMRPELLRAAELDLALDIGDATLPEPDAGRDPARPAEGEVADRQHRQAVDLADGRTLGVHQDHAAIDGFLRAVAQAVGALDVLLDGADHVLAGRGRRQRPVDHGL